MVRFRKLRSPRLTLAGVIDRVLLIFAFGLALAVLYRYFWLDTMDPHKCVALLTQGRWLDAPHELNAEQSFRNWQVPGCLVHEYKARDISSCLKSQRIVYIGDSTVRQIFWATAKKLDLGGAEDNIRNAEKHADLSFARDGVFMEFIWDPFLNSSRLYDELVAYRPRSFSTNSGSNASQSAAILLVGGGLWDARHIGTAPLKHFRDSIDNIVSFMTTAKLGKSSSFTSPSPSLANNRGSDNAFLLAPVQVPMYGSLSPPRAAAITPEKIDPMNDYLQQLSAYQGADILWSYSLMTRQVEYAYEESGIHVVQPVADQRADVLLNLRCNAEAAIAKGYPFDRTCCSAYRRLGWVQWLVLVNALAVLPTVTLIIMQDPKRLQMLPSFKLSRALLVLGLALAYCYLADRTQLFNKLQKQYVSSEFAALCAITFIFGILSVRGSMRPSSPVGAVKKSQKPSDQGFLSRDQTDEWKGWMQSLILIYHYTGGSRVLRIYELIRLLVASYLFMTGFGHTVFFIKRGDYSFRRCASVLVRLNLLSCLLPYVMRTDYLFYYFAPLVSFWYMIIYLTMGVGRSRNTSLQFVLAKILVSAILITTLIKIPGILDKLLLLLRYACGINWNVVEWRFRVSLDMYIVYIGMLSGILFVRISDTLHGDALSEGPFSLIRKHFYRLRIAFVVGALVILPSFWTITRRSLDKYDYNWWEPYVSCLPILSFVILRNSSRHLRNFHSSIFAWLGRCSLETFTLQFHIWLAGDTKGLLSPGVARPNGTHIAGRWQEFVAITSIFLWISWHVASATSVVTSWIIDPKEGRQVAEIEEPRTSEQNQASELPRSRRRNESEGAPKFHMGNGEILNRVVTRFARALREDLRLRIALLLGAMWFLNMTYT
ncbi:MAG: hypothetical protein FRX48_04240 [Lasallia pustulata]|uniref:Cas1p 10 TM acyl transferase domain-containing protein n=1 Tax=Lasallia pustulata TaxID=136370 RepID=A0A5M8PSY9_9LECA|nr:MAG: hypothetical protein FRX48_04240 [Lasallia pustulata]